MSQIHQLIKLLNETPQTTPPSTPPSTGPQQTKLPAVQIHNMLLYVCTELSIQETENAISNWQASHSSASPAPAPASLSFSPSVPLLSSSPSKASLPIKSKPMQMLTRLGKFLEGIFKHKAPVSRIVGKDVIGKGSRYLFDEVCYSLPLTFYASLFNFNYRGAMAATLPSPRRNKCWISFSPCSSKKEEFLNRTR